MTRKEKAISIIKNELACVKNVDCERTECRNCSLVMPEHDVIEALDIAIKALEQEPCDVSDTDVGKIDAVNRQAVINTIANTCFWLSSDNWEELIKCINSIPPVNPQPKTGCEGCIYEKMAQYVNVVTVDDAIRTRK